MLDELEKICVGTRSVYNKNKKKLESVQGRNKRAVGGAGKVASRSIGTTRKEIVELQTITTFIIEHSLATTTN